MHSFPMVSGLSPDTGLGVYVRSEHFEVLADFDTLSVWAPCPGGVQPPPLTGHLNSMLTAPFPSHAHAFAPEE